MEEAYQMNFTKTVESYESLNQGKNQSSFCFSLRSRENEGKISGGKSDNAENK